MEDREEIGRLSPHTLVRGEDDGTEQDVLLAVPCVVDVLHNNLMGVRIGAGTRELADADIGALLDVLDEAARMSSVDGFGG